MNDIEARVLSISNAPACNGDAAHPTAPATAEPAPELTDVLHKLAALCEALTMLSDSPLQVTIRQGTLAVTVDTGKEVPATPPLAPERLHRSRLDIIEVLGAAGHRLTTSKLMTALSKSGREWSDRTVAGELSRMVKDGTLTKDPGAHPAGYGLPEWGGEPATPAEKPARRGIMDVLNTD